ncbi:MAG: D-aminoacyl-tRNA deacylase [Gammaproteobacteria bacterium]
MIGLLQRVNSASVSVADTELARIGPGLLVLIAVEHGDMEQQADRLLERLGNYRVFPDTNGKMNLSLCDTGGELLLVPQFTLVADTRKGNRPGFSNTPAPAASEKLFNYLCEQARQTGLSSGCGKFGADMQVTLTNDGPVTFWLQVPPAGS